MPTETNLPERPRMLIADDHLIVATTLEEIFQREGFEVTVAFNGHAAMTAVASTSPHVVITDHVMPGPHGDAVGRAALARDANCTVFILSAHVGTRLPPDGTREGRLEYVLKPCGPRELIARVRKALAAD